MKRRAELERQLIEILVRAPRRLEALRAARSLDLPDWAIGAGFIRAAVWDWLSVAGQWSSVSDVDVIYFDPRDESVETEQRHESELCAALPDVPWSVRNQARMHRRNGDRPYISTVDALQFWLETPTCVAVRLAPDDRLEVIAPFGLDDLFDRIIRPTPRGRERIEAYRERLFAKRWQDRWAGVTIVGR